MPVEPAAREKRAPRATAPKAAPKPPAPAGPPPQPDYLTKDQIDWLLKGIEPYRVQHKGGKSNLQAYDVRNHLNEVFGFANWDGEVTAMDLVFDVPKTLKDNKPGAYVCYRATYRLTIKALSGKVLATYTEVAAGDGQMPANMRFEAHDFAMKTAESQALKRAAINLGNQFGLSLYAKGNTNGITRGTFNYPTPTTLAPLTEQITEETDPDATHEAMVAAAAAEATQAPQTPAQAPQAPAPTPEPATPQQVPPPVPQQQENTLDIIGLQQSIGWLSNEARNELGNLWKKTNIPPLARITTEEQLSAAWQLYDQVKPPPAVQPTNLSTPAIDSLPAEQQQAIVDEARRLEAERQNVDASWGLTQQRQAQVDQARRHFGVQDTPHPYSEDFPPADDNEPYQ